LPRGRSTGLPRAARMAISMSGTTPTLPAVGTISNRFSTYESRTMRVTALSTLSLTAERIAFSIIRRNTDSTPFVRMAFSSPCVFSYFLPFMEELCAAGFRTRRYWKGARFRLHWVCRFHVFATKERFRHGTIQSAAPDPAHRHRPLDKHVRRKPAAPVRGQPGHGGQRRFHRHDDRGHRHVPAHAAPARPPMRRIGTVRG